MTGLSGALAVGVDSGHIYWTTTRTSFGDEPPAEWVGTIGRANLDGSGAEQRFITGESHITDVAVDSGHVYWVNQAQYEPCFHCGPMEPPDTTPPDTVITQGAPKKTQRTKLNFRFASEDPFATFECRRDKRRWRSCYSPTTVRRLDRGRHTFRVRAIDRERNVDPIPAKDVFRVVRKGSSGHVHSVR